MGLMTPDRTAAGLLRAVGLLADGPVPWGRPLGAREPGVFLIELPSPLPGAPIELTRLGKWLERLPGMRLDGERPTSKQVLARMAAFWLPSQPVLFIGSSSGSVGGRVKGLRETPLGDRRPNPAGQWLQALTNLGTTRVWWASTDAVEEYEDALLEAFAAGVPEEERAALPDASVVLPWANLRTSAGARKRTGLTGTVVPEPPAAPTPPTRIVELPDGDADGARGEPPQPARRATASARSRASRAAEPARRAGDTGAGPAAPAQPRRDGTGRATRVRAPQPGKAPRAPVHLTAEGAARLRTELEELVTVRRPQVIARIRTAKELGDLKENADYTAAREEQSFLEGRIQALEAQLRDAMIIDPPAGGAHAALGSRVTVENDGDEMTYTLVGSAEADPANGRISVASPVGQALVGHGAGDEVVVRTPRGETRYRIVEVA